MSSCHCGTLESCFYGGAWRRPAPNPSRHPAQLLQSHSWGTVHEGNSTAAAPHNDPDKRPLDYVTFCMFVQRITGLVKAGWETSKVAYERVRRGCCHAASPIPGSDDTNSYLLSVEPFFKFTRLPRATGLKHRLRIACRHNFKRAYIRDSTPAPVTVTRRNSRFKRFS